MLFPIVIHKDKRSDYGVIVPDLPGCFSAGRTMDEAMAMAREAIELHLEGLIEDGRPIPKPMRIEDHRKNRDYAGGTWAIVSVDAARFRVNAKRINVTIPERVLDAVDRFARKSGETRSGLLVRAVTTFMERKSDKHAPSRSRPRRRRRRRTLNR